MKMVDQEKTFAAVDIGEELFQKIEILEAENASLTIALMHGRITDPEALIILADKHARRGIALRNAWMNLLREYPVLDQEGHRSIDWIKRRIIITYPDHFRRDRRAADDE
jgi:hypothetical protein